MNLIPNKRFAIGMVLCLISLSAANGQNAPTPPVTMPLQSPTESYKLGQTIVLKIEVVNNSEGSIGFSESFAGAFDVQVIDLSDKSLPDLMDPIRKKAAKSEVQAQTMEVEVMIGPGEQRKFDVSLFTGGLVRHAGKYKVVVSRRDIESGKMIFSNPISITMIGSGN